MFIVHLGLIVTVFLASCSQPDFSSGGAYNGHIKVKPKTEDLKKPTVKSQFFLASDIATIMNSDGVAGACNQQFLTGGKKLYDEKILPALRSNMNNNIIAMPFYFHSDLLVNILAATCPKSQTNWSRTNTVRVCQRSGGGLGPSQLDQEFGTASVCGTTFSGQTPVGASDENIKAFDVQGEEPRHLVIATHKLGTSIPAEKFVELLRKKLGTKLTISLIYPKAKDQCIKLGVNPPDNDTMWIGIPSASKGPSDVFEQIALLSGGKTFDLCSPTDLETLKGL